VTVETKTVAIGHATIAVAAGKTARISFKLNSQGVALLRKRHHLSVRISVTVDLTGKAPVKSAHTITISKPKPARKHEK
jgi:hypothetical protein